ncbi:bifunctional 2-C-methyl-D-erythritol 4-phosphate cytidylyltransferase/2-C-methyl-D-erythritol 2,4-cyclodiphosphate synthase [Sphingomonas sp. KR1UV-12]|uniref:Bifunctional enzyme IspD/IspF n=1 Tax=Sphingomonas aurea TaxID=3063994 RepID=A0ABT9EGS6_9SPHN|nr:bifunctional 2-C-methyl-D-erythritol 4-phosphate cytidylyltransferase/2-C-methyl-D-erythritol 2,4-cyclodiphosphate synthase [Sphingomonas sp. KR1UV-12]MDP1026169.1 bifunctional 2-C-methyl-D-erythritol 4-phosphate cytidylyltransferase/2-C-methyl-D-erythritol 2,4-cyclodiphosphate synthase [Sphingomonas sp. KR1UV-12]
MTNAPAPRTAALIVAAGRGLRAGTALPKQYAPVAGQPMLAHAYRAFAEHPGIDTVLVMVAEGQQAMARDAVGADARIGVGGVLRLDTVRIGLDLLGSETTRVLVHDAARPFVPAGVIDRVLAALDEADGAVPTLAVVDTLNREDGTLVPRAGLHRVQTPQGFRIAVLARAHAAWPAGEDASDDAQMVRALGGRVELVQGDAMLEKVTYPEDFAAAEARIRWETRSASGFDVHRLEAGEELWLGGVLIPHDRGLSGHSDADVVLHALTDALLGTIAAGDIGTHFPPSDPQWRGAASDQFLAHAATLIADKGGRIDFVDLTILCEAPKIGPHRAAMIARIAEILTIDPARVSVKATTTERLGFTGREEGIATQAIATVSLPEMPR